jgi:uncharacterized phage protein (TIGR01671 family)
MNREIKFRAWDGKEMRYDGLMVRIDGAGVASNKPEAYELMQSTGLKDKNGKEIYEGDILEDNNYPEDGISRAIVQFDDEDGGWTTNPWKLGGRQFDDYEVVGNVYENAELLK